MAPQVQAEIDRINQLLPPFLKLRDGCSPEELWAVIFRLHTDYVEGPAPHKTWKDAAINEKQKRVR